MPAYMSQIIMGTKKGLTLVSPLSSSTECCLSNVPMPPRPDPKMTPTRSASIRSMSSPALSKAWLAAYTA